MSKPNSSFYGQPVSSFYNQSVPQYYIAPETSIDDYPRYQYVNRQPVYEAIVSGIPIVPETYNNSYQYNQPPVSVVDQPVYQPPVQPNIQPPVQLIYQPPVQQIYQPPVQQIYQPPVQQIYQPPVQSLFLASGELSNTQKSQIVDAHNKYRSVVNPPAANMPAMTWSDDLAKSADKWASQCTWTHSGQSGVGENLYASWPKASGLASYNPTAAINDWASESVNYNYDTNTCSPGKVCGHYTQVVWANSNKVGCAVQNCDQLKNSGFPNGGTIMVCQYSPPGNYIGQKPYTRQI